MSQKAIRFAIASSGVHANGFSLVRKLIERDNLNIMAGAPFAPSVSLAEALLAPTRIYTDTLKAALAAGKISSVSHITGGGLIENPPRVYGEGLAMHLDMTERPVPELFKWLKAGLAFWHRSTLVRDWPADHRPDQRM